MSPRLYGVVYYAFVPSDWTGPDDGSPWESILPGESYYNAVEKRHGFYSPEHIDKIAAFLADLARLYGEAAARGDHRIPQENGSWTDLHRDRPCDCGKRAEMARNRTRNEWRTMAVRVQVRPMRFRPVRDIPGCGCREAMCPHVPFDRPRTSPNEERRAITRLLASFSREMNRKLIAKVDAGRGGWADEDWTVDDIKKALVEHIERGDPVDVANFCAFWWNRLGGDR